MLVWNISYGNGMSTCLFVGYKLKVFLVTFCKELQIISRWVYNSSCTKQLQTNANYHFNEDKVTSWQKLKGKLEWLQAILWDYNQTVFSGMTFYKPVFNKTMISHLINFKGKGMTINYLVHLREHLVICCAPFSCLQY